MIEKTKPGDKFNRLTAIRRVGTHRNLSPLWEFKCDCGSIGVFKSRTVRIGHTKSCGCQKADSLRIAKRHGHARGCGQKSKEYRAWNNMRSRCKYEAVDRFSSYGGRGIAVCERWNDFALFLDDVGMAPSNKHTIERLDVNGPYEPGNVCWATAEVQVRNKRANFIIEVDGSRMTFTEACRFAGIPRHTGWKKVHEGVCLEAIFKDRSVRIIQLPASLKAKS